MKRLTKKESYARRGIAFDGRHITTPVGEACELLKAGNTKTGRSVLTWSMNQTTCPFHCKGCYADAGHYQRASVRRSLDINTKLARDHLEFLERALRAQLDTLKDGSEVRIHAVGDFFSRPYLEMWRRIVRDYPRLVFWTYTKYREYESAFDAYPNGNIVPSIVGGHGFNFGHCAHVIDMYRALKEAGEHVHICRCGIDPNQHCAGCHMCSDSKYVLFVEHSTDYVAGKDPRYGELVALIESQDMPTA